MKYIQSIDSIRAFAVLLVITTHWFGENHKLSILANILNGVDIFFVLSGFLITRILIQNSLQAKNGRYPIMIEYKNFFFRRVLRIFPIYYLTIFILYLLGPLTETNIREEFIYFSTYTANFYFYKIKAWDGIISHLWSLSVEEQFYLIWPFIVLFSKRSNLLMAILTAIVIGIIGQYMTDVGGLLTFACFDALGIGALLAWLIVYKPDFIQKFYPAISWIAITSFIVLTIRMGLFYYDIGVNPYKIPIRTLTSIITFWCLCFILLNRSNKGSFSDKILNNNFLLFLGKISYGLYLYHLLIPYFTNKFLLKLNASFDFLTPSLKFYLLQLENFIILIALSWVSFHVLEKPFLNLKHYFISKSMQNQTGMQISIPQEKVDLVK